MHLNPLQPNVAFPYPLKTSENLKPLGFLMFSGGIEKQHWAVMAYYTNITRYTLHHEQNLRKYFKRMHLVDY